MKTEKIKMLKDEKGSTDGINVRVFYKDKEYDLPTDLVKAFVDDMQVAERVKSKAVTEAWKP